MDDGEIIRVEGLSKVYPLYDRPFDRLKEALHVGGRKYHRDFYALKDLSFEIRRGETLGIIGRNGSGKSTLLKILAGVLTPTTGQVEVNGRVSALLELGAGFNPEFTGMENAYLQGTLMGYSRQEMDVRIPSIESFADIGEFIHQPVKHYSSGMFVRLAFACAVNVEPDILIVDEALAVGDIEFQQKSYQEICRLKDSGVSILLASHDLGSIVEFCSKAILLDRGGKASLGHPGEVVNNFKQLLSTNMIKPAATPVPETASDVGQWTGALHSHFNREKCADEYGGGVATIRDWGILNKEGQPSSLIDNGEASEVRIELQFNGTCNQPIVGYFLTDAKGREIVGTNTEFEGIRLGQKKGGDAILVRFKQKLAVSPGVYFLNIGCSEYVGGEIVAHHRLYNLMTITVHSRKRFVGFSSLDSEVKVDDLA